MNSATNTTLLSKIISGGQTGVDRGALDAAIELGIEHGGKCPRGRLAEDGRIPEKYLVQETASARYSFRTERNVIEADGTLILHYGPISGGTAFTKRMALKNHQPFIQFDLTAPPDMDEVVRWIVEHSIETLNVAGPRESSCSGIGSLARQLCVELFTLVRSTQD